MQYQESDSSWGNHRTTRARRRSSCSNSLESVVKLASVSAVVIFSSSSCCMCHAMKTLFSELGVSPTVYELDHDPNGKGMERALAKLLGNSPAVPVVKIGGELVGSMDRVMASILVVLLSVFSKKPGSSGFNSKCYEFYRWVALEVRQEKFTNIRGPII